MPGARSWTIRRYEVQSAEKRRIDQERHPDQPQRLTLSGSEIGERGVRRPAVVGGATWHEEAGEHHEAAGQIQPVARHVQPGKRHVRRANLERHDVVAKGAESERHDTEEHHDGAVHGPELVVELREKNAAGRVGLTEPSADERDRLCREGLLPSDQHHEGETHQQEEQAGEPVLQADDLMVRGKNVPAYQSWHLTQPCETRASEWCIFLAAFEGVRTSSFPSRS